MELRFVKATIADLDMLVETRIEVLRAANKLNDGTDMSEVEKESRVYYKRALVDGLHVAILVFEKDKFVGAGGVSFYAVMPTFHNHSGQRAYIMNMYTAPDYRRRGIAYHTLDLLIAECRKRNICQITLEATQDGKYLYEKYGFSKMNDEMELVTEK